MEKQDYISLIAKSLTNEVNLKESETLETMRSSDQEFSSTYDDLQEIWEAAGDYTPNVAFDSATAYDKFAAKYEIPTDYTKSSNSNFKRILLATVIAVLLFSSSLFVYLNYATTDSVTNSSAKVETITHNNEEISLSPGASIDFNEDGSVSDVQGNVFFDKNKKIEYKLNGETLVSEGASFNISKEINANELRVDVKEGSVKVVGQDGNEEIITSNQSMVYNLNNGTLNTFDATSSNNYLLWASNKLSFNKTSINSVFEEMETFFGVAINVSGNVPSDCHFTAPIINNASLATVFELLDTSFDFSITQTGDGEFEVSSVTCK